jgi:hypothetical protein
MNFSTGEIYHPTFHRVAIDRGQMIAREDLECLLRGIERLSCRDEGCKKEAEPERMNLCCWNSANTLSYRLEMK